MRMRAGALAAVALAVHAVAGASVAGAAQAAGHPSGGGELLYVTNQSDASVSVIDLASHAVAATVDLERLGFSANAKPHDVVVEPDGAHWYVSLIGENKVLKFDRHNRLVGAAEFETPGMLHRHPDGRRLFVGRSMTAPTPPQRIGVIGRADMALEEMDVFFPRPHALAIDPAGRYVFTASLAENRIMTVNAATHEVTFTAVEGPTHVLAHFAISPDGARLVVSGERTGTMLIFDAARAPALTLLATVEVNPAPWHPVFTPDGRFVYVGNQRAHTVTVLDTRDWSVAAVIAGEGLAEPHGSAVSPDGRYVYISNRNLQGRYNPRGLAHPPGTVVVISTATRTIEKVIEVERDATGMGMAHGHH